MNNIRPMTQADVPRVAEIHVLGWRTTYRNIVSDSILFGKMSVARSIDRFTQLLRTADSDNNGFVYDDGFVKGFMTTLPCQDSDMSDYYELGGLYIDPFMQRQGIGTKLLAYYEETAQRKGYQSLCLWVLTENKNARTFYEKMGYTPDGTSQFLDGLDTWEVRYTKILSRM